MGGQQQQWRRHQQEQQLLHHQQQQSLMQQQELPPPQRPTQQPQQHREQAPRDYGRRTDDSAVFVGALTRVDSEAEVVEFNHLPLRMHVAAHDAPRCGGPELVPRPSPAAVPPQSPAWVLSAPHVATDLKKGRCPMPSGSELILANYEGAIDMKAVRSMQDSTMVSLDPLATADFALASASAGSEAPWFSGIPGAALSLNGQTMVQQDVRRQPANGAGATICGYPDPALHACGGHGVAEHGHEDVAQPPFTCVGMVGYNGVPDAMRPSTGGHKCAACCGHQSSTQEAQHGCGEDVALQGVGGSAEVGWRIAQRSPAPRSPLQHNEGQLPADTAAKLAGRLEGVIHRLEQEGNSTDAIGDLREIEATYNAALNTRLR